LTAGPRAHWGVCLVAAAAAAAACDAGKTKIIGADYPAAACGATPAPPPASLQLDPFYTKYLDANGIPVLASAVVADRALLEACTVVVHVLGPREDLRQALVARRMRVAVIGRAEVTTDIPEYRDLDVAFPLSNWDALRGVGATLVRPVSSCGEENILCTSGDIFAGETILVQTFASSVLLGIEDIDSTFDSRLQAAYDSARAAGLWSGTFADETVIAYYTEGVQDWFDANGEASPPDGTHNDVNTRAELEAYDPALAALVAEYMAAERWSPSCP
jgi:hypothetical protein